MTSLHLHREYRLTPAIVTMGVLIGATLSWASTYQQVGAQDEQPRPRRDYRALSIEVANWLDSMAIPNPDGPGIVWKISDRRAEHDWSLYSGTSGVVLFYLQLHRQTENPRYLAQAESGGLALINAVEGAQAEMPAGFWVGLAGCGYVLNELATESEDVRFEQAAHRAVDRLLKDAQRDRSGERTTAKWSNVTDIISGNAGIGQFLLYAEQQMGRSDCLELAIAVGDGLLGDAIIIENQTNTDEHSEPLTMKWKMSPQFDREMPNYSHGTAGVADFLLQLWSALQTEHANRNGERFLESAQAAAAYLRQSAVVTADSALIAHHLPGGEELFYLGWCHGPVGTGRFLDRIAHHEDTSNAAALDREVTRLGLRSLAQPIDENDRPEGLWNNVGLCCGTAGIAAYLLEMKSHDEMNQRGLDQLARLNEDLIRRADKVELQIDDRNVQGLKWTQAEHRVRPDLLEAQTGLMQGAAGIGLWLLRMDADQRGLEFPYQLPINPQVDMTKRKDRSSMEAIACVRSNRVASPGDNK